MQDDGASPSVTVEWMHQTPGGHRELQTVVKGSFFVEVPAFFPQAHGEAHAADLECRPFKYGIPERTEELITSTTTQERKTTQDHYTT